MSAKTKHDARPQSSLPHRPAAAEASGTAIQPSKVAAAHLPTTATQPADEALPGSNERPRTFAVDVAKLSAAFAKTAKARKPSASTSAMNFGRYVRQVVDATPESAEGALAMAKFLRLDPVGKAIEKLETADERLETRVAALEAGHGSSRRAETPRPTPAKKSRRGRRNREAGLDCTGQMLAVLRHDSRAAVFSGRAWEERLKERFGEDEGFGRRTIEKQPLYKKHLRPAVVAAVKSYGATFEADFLEHGLELWSHKPGRGDKRKDHTEKQAMAGRVFMAALENATIDAER